MLKLRVNELYFFLRVLLFFEEKCISEKEKKSFENSNEFNTMVK